MKYKVFKYEKHGYKESYYLKYKYTWWPFWFTFTTVVQIKSELYNTTKMFSSAEEAINDFKKYICRPKIVIEGELK